ncbi:FAD-binding oxidoreductase [Cellvibrio mixtus]|uniref:FAD-binding oxidoreductase n=1 Tax=Cellvibrio mixtus TaxID=39650 RepID=UPI0006932183|nr:FAD-binding oxidoreductase [Cellvibrio mixtus]
MDRRKFLAVSLTTTALSACGGGSGGGNGSIASSSSSVSSENGIWGQLATQLSGTVLRPGQNDYELLRRVYNTRYDHIKPVAVVRCTSVQDVQATLAFARSQKLAIVPRSGGHGYAGYSTTEGIVLDLGQMKSIQVGPGTATIGAGARLVDIYDQLGAQGVGIPAGSCPTVGIGGLTLGGGIGIVDRAYGLTCDNLLAAEVVLADGRVIECDAQNHADLFWALRGGGGGNFGVVTRFTFKTHTTADITTFDSYFDFNDFTRVMSAWQAWPETLPNHIWAQAIPGWNSPSSSPALQIRVFCIGSIADMTPHWQHFLQQAGVTPLWVSQVTEPYRSVMLSGCGELNIPACHVQGDGQGQYPRNAFAASSDFFAKPIPEEGLLVLKQAILDSQLAGNYGMMIMDLMHGAIDELAADETAFVHRGALFSVEYYTWFRAGTANNQVDAAQVWVNSFRQTLSPWTTGGAYVNYIDPLISNYEVAYYGANYPRLQQVKATYDPDWLFKIPQGVKPL